MLLDKIEEMKSRVTLSLRERAILAWRQERPIREAARLEKLVRQMAAVREKLTRILGEEYEIKIGIDANGKILATVEDLRFSVSSYTSGFYSIYLIERCPECNTDCPVGIVTNLADVGQILEEVENVRPHQCN